MEENAGLDHERRIFMSKLAEWARSVKCRDGKCMHCGSLEDLHAHHIRPKSAYPELILDVENGIALCYRCHKKEHETNRIPVKRDNVRQQRRTLEKTLIKLENEVMGLTKKLEAARNDSAKLDLARKDIITILTHASRGNLAAYIEHYIKKYK